MNGGAGDAEDDAPPRAPASRLPYGRHCIEADDVAAVAAVLAGASLTGGPAVEAFERALATAVGARHAVACGTGTAALHLAVLAAGMTPEDAAVVPAVTFLATANAVRFAGAEVVFADVAPDTGLMTPETLRDALACAGGRRIAAVLPVHLNGQEAELPGLAAVAAGAGAVLIEDACHALGTERADGSRTGDGRYGRLTAFSFHPVKTIAAGEGGAVTTGDDELARRLRLLRNHGMTRDPAAFTLPDQAFDENGEPNPWYYEMSALGFNHRLSEIHCALGLSQLRKLGRLAARRRALAARYDRLLAPLAPLIRPIRRLPGQTPAWHLYAVLIDFAAAGVGRAALMRRLDAAGIGSQVHYMPLYRQPYYRDRYGARTLPGAEAYYRRCLSLPLFPTMAETDTDRVVAALAAALRPM